MKNHPQMGMVGLTLPIFACATVDIEKYCHGLQVITLNVQHDVMSLCETALRGPSTLADILVPRKRAPVCPRK